jgi:uncharacterized protein (DUF934 family)
MSAQVIRHGRIEADDWLRLAEDEVVQPGRRQIISLARARRETVPVDAEIGVLLPNTEDVDLIAAEVLAFPLIALQFPTFGDGRAYSQARLLRQRHGYQGELRAVGDVLRDEMQLLARCGFDAMVPRADQNLADCLAALGDFTLAYQPAADRMTSILEQRRAGR